MNPSTDLCNKAMQYYQAWLNARDMRAETPFDHIG
jgi:hypothetical protein